MSWSTIRWAWPDRSASAGRHRLATAVSRSLELVVAGKVCALVLSEVPPELIVRAHVVHPITALQSECPLWERRTEDRITATCRDVMKERGLRSSCPSRARMLEVF